MCGPTIVVRRDQESGTLVYCRHCGGGAIVHKSDGAIRLESTGERGDAEALQPDVDVALIDGLVAEASSVLGLARAGIAV